MAEPDLNQREEGFASAEGRSDLEFERPRKIIHVDMDAFYASVEQRDNPALRGKPVAVGGSRERGVVAAASYEARKFGVRSAMPSVTARRKCPDLIFVKPRFDVYKEVSRQIRSIFAEHTAIIEPLSLDEAYLDVTENLQGIASGTEIAEQIRAKIRAETQLTASAGVSYNPTYLPSAFALALHPAVAAILVVLSRASCEHVEHHVVDGREHPRCEVVNLAGCHGPTRRQIESHDANLAGSRGRRTARATTDNDPVSGATRCGWLRGPATPRKCRRWATREVSHIATKCLLPTLIAPSKHRRVSVAAAGPKAALSANR